MRFAERPACFNTSVYRHSYRQPFGVNSAGYCPQISHPSHSLDARAADEPACIKLGGEDKVKVALLAAYSVSQSVMGGMADSGHPGWRMANGPRRLESSSRQQLSRVMLLSPRLTPSTSIRCGQTLPPRLVILDCPKASSYILARK